MLAIIGILGGVLSLLSNIPYIIDTIRRKTKPQRVTWGIFFLLNITFLFNQSAIGATDSLWLISSFAISTLIIFCLSMKYGVGGHGKRDVAIFAGAVLGVILWFVLNQPIFSVIMSLVVATLAVIPTFIKAYRDPRSETSLKWLLGGIAALLTVIAVGKLDLVVLFPIYSFLTQAGIYAVIVYRTK
jgi:hypothetical protein